MERELYYVLPWPEYQQYMEAEWFRDCSYYCADNDVYTIPKKLADEFDKQEYPELEGFL